MRLEKDTRLALWDRLNSEKYAQYKTGVEGAWRFSTLSDTEGLKPHIWIVGAVHGNEAVGAVVIERLMNLATQGQLIEEGTVTFVIGNPQAFLSDVRYIDRDLNRAFALDAKISEGQAKLELETVRQAELHRLLSDRPPAFVLDLHSVSRGDHGIIVYPEASHLWAERLGCIGTHFCYSRDHMAGDTLIDAAHEYGAAAMVVECGHHHSPNTSLVALAHIEKVFHYFGVSHFSLTKAPLPLFSTIIRYRSMGMIKPHRGFHFLFPVETGTRVEAGVTYAKDDFGAHSQRFTAWLMMPSLVVHEDDEDAGWFCSRELIPTAEIEQDNLYSPPNPSAKGSSKCL